MTVSRRVLLSASFASLLRASDDTSLITHLGGSLQRDPAGAIIGINLGDTFVNDADILDLLAFKKLQRLDLSHTRITDEGLLRLKPASQIEDLSLLYTELITDLGINAIKGWRKLKVLNIRGTRISDESLHTVSALGQLESLDVANTRITDDGLEYLASLTRLKHLALGRSQVTEPGLQMLRVLSTLESLDLGGPPARNQRKGASAPMLDSAVAAIAALQELRVLKLGHSNIDVRGLRQLAKLGKVEKLGLECCPRVDDEAIKELLAWKNLKYLDLQETKVTEAGVAALQAAKPGMRLLSGPFSKPATPESRAGAS